MKIRCLKCAAINDVIVIYSIFDIKQETRVDANCEGCGNLLQEVLCCCLEVRASAREIKPLEEGAGQVETMPRATNETLVCAHADANG